MDIREKAIQCLRGVFNYIKKVNGNVEMIESDSKVIIKSLENCQGAKIPTIVIRDIISFYKLSMEYYEALEGNYTKEKLKSVNNDKNYFIARLLTNSTESDLNNILDFIKRYILFNKNNKLNLYNNICLGKIDGKTIEVRNVLSETYFETPFHFYAAIRNSNPDYIYEFPVIRYGIADNICYIYAIQGNKNLIEANFYEEVNGLIRKVNRGVKKIRNVSPSAIVILTIFLGILQTQKIYSLRIAKSLWARIFIKESKKEYTEEELNVIFYNMNVRFINNFKRLEYQFEDIKLADLENDDQSFVTVTLDKKLHTSNETLKSIYQLAYDSGNIVNKNLKEASTND